MSRNTLIPHEVVTTDDSSSSFKGKPLLSDAKMKKELKMMKTKVQDINADRNGSEKGSKLINVESLLESVAASSSQEDKTPSSFASTKKSSTKVLKFANRSPAEIFALDHMFMLQMQKEKDPWSADKTTDDPEDVLAALVYYRTYSRGGQPWWQCVQRVVEGTFRVQQDHFKVLRKKWDPRKAQKTAQEMYRRIFSMKFLPPGRGLWAMGTKIVEEKGLNAALNNCAFVSTKNIDKDFAYPFVFLMDASMLGVGVGTDMKGAEKAKIYRPIFPGETYLIPDSREGWVESVRMLLQSHSRNNRPCVYFDYSLIRKEGTPLVTFGGVSAGAGPLKKLHDDLRKTLERCQGSTLDSRGIADICNQIGVAVVSGNIRRTAEILFGDTEDEVFLNLKNYDVFPERGAYGWTSNNSIYAKLGMDYSKAAERIRTNGEPGFIWLENAQAYSRMMDNTKDWKDHRVAGANPCVEQSLEDGEMCNLVETFPNNHENLKDYLETLRYAFLYAKTVTLLPSHWEKTNDVMLRNRRIGTSQSGLQQFVADHSISELKEWCNVGYDHLVECDKVFSDLFAVPRSIKITTIKPSGTVSLIAGATPGMHWPISNYYIRRVTLAKNSPYVQKLRDAKYVVEESAYDPTNSVVVEIPVCAGENVRCQKDVSMWEQFEFAAFLQKYWADNQVSCTVTFNKENEGSQIETALNHYQYRLKGISLLPSSESSKVYKVFGKFTKQDIRWLTPGAVGDDTFFPDLVECKYDSNEDSTLLEFDSHLSSEFIQTTLDNLKKAGKNVDSKSVTPYKQMPYETITKDVYLDMIKCIRPVEWHTEMYSNEDIPKSSKMSLPSELMYCDGDKCVL